MVLLVVSVRYGLFQRNLPGPGLFPAIMAALLLLASAAWLFLGAGRPSRGAGSATLTAELAEAAQVDPNGSDAPDWMRELDAGEDEAPLDRAGVRRIAFVVVWTAVPLLLLEPLGYVITMTLYVAGLLAVTAQVRPWKAVAGALVGAAVTGWGADALGIVLPDPLGLLRAVGG